MNTARIKVRFFRLLFIQAGFFVCASALLWGIFGWIVAFSALLGSGVFLLPTLVFGWFAFRYQGARQAKQVLGHLYWGEALKIFFAIALFAVVFKTQQISVVAFFTAYLANQWAMIVVLAFLVPRRSTKTAE